jgi:hypothetical protein
MRLPLLPVLQSGVIMVGIYPSRFYLVCAPFKWKAFDEIC